MARWFDHGVMPPVLVPETVDAALTYLTHALGHPCYERWTLRRVKQAFPSLREAKTAKPVLFNLLLDHSEAVEWWESGRLRTAEVSSAPAPADVMERLLRNHRQRFRLQEQGTQLTPDREEDHNWLAIIDPHRVASLSAWLSRGGRFVNGESTTNTLAVQNDTLATSLFLRDRASRSRHTLRAYGADLRRLIGWCRDQDIGPLSDLTRNDLLRYRDYLRRPRISVDTDGQRRVIAVGDRSQARALAVVASLFQYWFDTRYLIANPASGLVVGLQARNEFAPKRFLPTAALCACDAWMKKCVEAPDIAMLRRRAIWVLYRYGGIRLAELAWEIDTNLPRIAVDMDGQWTLYVDGKGNKPRAVPLPNVIIEPVSSYRSARGLPPAPAPHEVLPLIHGLKGGTLREAGLYREVKAIFTSVAATLETDDPMQASLLSAASPHWLRHAYAKALVVDHQVPLPVAQALLGHASVQTTAAYSKTDLTQLRTFVNSSFNT